MGLLPSWMGGIDSAIRKDQNRTSAAQEARRAAETGGKVQPGSGCSWRRPQDVQTPTHLEQVKYTSKGRYVLNDDELFGILDDALRDGREPRLVVEFTSGLRAVIEIERYLP